MYDFQTRCDRTAQALEAAARAAEMAISGDLRIGEQDAAALLGLSVSRLRALRYEGAAPQSFTSPVGGARRSYRIDALARWIEIGREK